MEIHNFVDDKKLNGSRLVCYLLENDQCNYGELLILIKKTIAGYKSMDVKISNGINFFY